MDLRLINISEDSLKESLDVGNAEFAKKETESKNDYKDLLKAAISLKIHLNELIRNEPRKNQKYAYASLCDSWYDLLYVNRHYI